MYCNKCGKTISDDSNFCEHCGFNLDLNKKNKQMVEKKSKTKKIVIAILIIGIVVGVTISAINHINYRNYQNELTRKNEIFDKIKQFDTNITWEELALNYNCSIEDLTIENLQNTLDKYQEIQKRYNEEQQEYNSKYKNKLKEAKEKCKVMIKNEVFENNLYIAFNSYSNSSYHFTPKSDGAEIDAIAEINVENETIRKICMTMEYSCSIERFEVDIRTSKMNKYNESGTVLVQGELDLTTNELSLYCIECYNYYGNLVNQEGKPIDMTSKYTKPRIISEKNQNIYEWDEKIDTNDKLDVEYYEEKLENKTSETSEVSENYDTSNIYGTYTDKAEAIKSEGYGTSYNVYTFKSGTVEHIEDMTTYKGTYTIKDNKIIITYTGAYDIEDPIKLDKFNDELTIKDENTLITLDNIEYIKE